MQDALQDIVPDDQTPEKPAVLNLNEITGPDFPVIIGEDTYYMVSRHDLSMADREEIRLAMMQVTEFQDTHEGKGGQPLSVSEKKVYDDVERRLCQIALPKAPRKVIDSLEPHQRNALLELFFDRVDVVAIVQSYVANTLQRMKRQAAANQAPTPLTPMRKTGSRLPVPPEDLLGPKRSSTTGANESETSVSAPA